MENAMPEDFDNPSPPEAYMELSAEPSEDMFNLEEEVEALLADEIPDLGKVELPDGMEDLPEVFEDAQSRDDGASQTREKETRSEKVGEQHAEPNAETEPLQPQQTVAEEEDFSEEYLFGPDEPANTVQAAPDDPARSVQAGSDDPAKTVQGGATSEPQAQKESTTQEDSEELQKEVLRQLDEGEYDPKTSRYTRNEKGNLVFKWLADYAPRGGGGRAQCKDSDCLERHEQGGIRTIEKGSLRIGRRVFMDDHGGEGHIQIMWYHARCIFNTFLRARKSTRIIESEFDIEGFNDLTPEDQDMLRRLIDGNENLKNVRFRSFDGSMPKTTPQKRAAGGAGDPDGIASSSKRQRKEEERRTIAKGDRVWTFFRCLPPEGPAPGGIAVSVKSKVPELAMVAEDIDSSTVVVQFESADHEKDRLSLYMDRKGRRIKGWLRYPRVFEGKKQRVPLDWIQWKRDPPKLCSCTKQAWNHYVPLCGIHCGRGTTNKVWGVAS